MGGVWHLTKRFFGSLKPGPPESRDNAWALRHFTEGETKLWKRMSNPDKRHAIGVANAVGMELGPDTPKEVIAAALLHDVGKVESGFRTGGRVVATVFWVINNSNNAEHWTHKKSIVGRFARYRMHPKIGSELLAEAGASPLTVAWAAEHHLPPDQVTVPPEFADALRRHDDD